MKHSNKSKRLVSGMLGTACLLSLFSGVAMADVNVSMEQGTPETKIELNKTYKGEKEYGYYSFIPEETGAYLLDNNDFNDEVDSFAFVYCFDDASSLALFRKGDDSYGIFEKGKEYSISVGNEEDGYELTVKKADFGASLYPQTLTPLLAMAVKEIALMLFSSICSS